MESSSMSPEIPLLIPAPARLEPRAGQFRLADTSRLRIAPACPGAEEVGHYLAAMIERGAGFRPELVGEHTAPAGSITLISAPEERDLGAEGYALEVEPNGVALRAAAGAGLFYGAQTLLQLLPAEIFGGAEATAAVNREWTVPAVRIVDTPRFAWRGMLLDCCRHFMDKAYIKRAIDLLAQLKMNRLHWHLTEDQGWRLEIERYPQLTRVGAWRRAADGGRYGGFYSRADVREIIEHAARRHVTVVPEIELPGHATAALASYPELSCRGEPLAVETKWGIFDDVYCAGNGGTFVFLEDVLSEVLDLFPSPYIHLGGDECPKTRWRKCPRCQARIRAAGLRGEDELQSDFIHRVGNWLQSRGRRWIGWDEILDGGLPAGATVQSWRGLEGAVSAARLGHDAIVSPVTHAYFDYDLSRIDLRRVYDFEPVPPGLSDDERSHILGGECNMWTEHAPQETVDRKLFPRILAMAERLWSPGDRRDFDAFRRRVRHHYARLRELGVDYGPES